MRFKCDPLDMTIKVDGSVDLDSGTVRIRETILGQVSIYVAETREAVIRKALIELGWTPPKEEA